MAGSVNKIRNPHFSAGRSAPSGWTWRATSARCRWIRDGKPGDGIVLESPGRGGSAGWSQVVPCKPGEFYRVEVEVVCDLEAADAESGFVLAVQPLTDKKQSGRKKAGSKEVAAGEASVTPAIVRSTHPTVVRAYYETPAGTPKLDISVRIDRATGTARVSAVRMMHILEPDEVGHPLAVPPPPLGLPAPRRAERVLVVAKDTGRVIVERLGTALGPRNVSAVDPAKFTGNGLDSDAVILADPEPPSRVRSLRALFGLAAERTVIISLPAFVKLAGDALSLRHVEQPDDPMHAKIAFANEYTSGFALADAFPHQAAGKRPGTFSQNHLRTSAAQKAFFQKHDIVSLLLSVAAHDATSDRPMCLFKRFEGGSLFVYDIEPAETEPSTCGETVMPIYFLLNLLGRPQTHLGQFSSPYRREAGFREGIRELSRRILPFVIHEDDVPVEKVHEQLVTIGREETTYGLPMAPRPVILVRSGLHAGDVESIYGAWLWFKQLVRMTPHECSYASELVSGFRLAWVPCVAPWEWGDGFRRSHRPPPHGVEVDCEPGQIAALIDVVSIPRNEARVVLPSGEGSYRRYVDWLPMLARSFPAGSYMTFGPPEGSNWADRDGFAWRMTEFSPKVSIDQDLSADEAYGRVMAAGGMVIRVEVPGCDFDFSTDSIRRTDVAATLLEHVIGLQYGLIAVNRQPKAMRFDGMRPVEAGETIVLRRDDPTLQAMMHQVG